MKIGVLTSSRADFGIYQPLLKKLQTDEDIEMEIIAFGTHTSRFHGYTLKDIQKAGFENIHRITTVLANDDESAVATSYALTAMKFADFWSENSYDLVFCLGDRYEMNAAVQAGIPFGIRFAHLHGGETTLGAIDNIYRHQISLASELHFTSTETYAEKVKELTGNLQNVYPVGALSLDGIDSLQLPEIEKVRREFDLPEGPYTLVTFHPETVSPESNTGFALEMKFALGELARDICLVITMPNADTLGSVFREELMKLRAEYPDKVNLVENFGKLNYFAAMKHCSFMLGNTSSGIIEAASLGKYAVNVGDRQKGRERSKNVIDCDFDRQAILQSCYEAMKKGNYTGPNVYYRDGAADRIMQVIKQL